MGGFFAGFGSTTVVRPFGRTTVVARLLSHGFGVVPGRHSQTVSGRAVPVPVAPPQPLRPRSRRR